MLALAALLAGCEASYTGPAVTEPTPPSTTEDQVEEDDDNSGELATDRFFRHQNGGATGYIWWLRFVNDDEAFALNCNDPGEFNARTYQTGNGLVADGFRGYLNGGKGS